MVRKVITAAMLTAALGAASIPAQAEIFLHEAPPPPRHEVAPQPRHGYIWAPGHWDAQGNRYRWVKGNWVRERPGFHYRETTWVERDQRWYREGGSWVRGNDRDHDGTPSRADRHPDNPNRP
jgi:hypothetical protein